MHTLKEIFEALSKTENGGELVADLQSQLSGIRSEAAASRVSKNKVLETLGLRNAEDPDVAVAELAKTITALQQAGGNPTALGTQVAALQAQVKELTGKYAASEEKAKAEREKRVATAIQSQIVSALTEGKAIKPEVFAKLLAGNVKAKDDDSLVFMNQDKELSVTDGVKQWLTDNPWAIKNDSQNGAGSGGGKPNGNGKLTWNDVKGMSRSEINSHWDEISKGVDS